MKNFIICNLILISAIQNLWAQGSNVPATSTAPAAVQNSASAVTAKPNLNSSADLTKQVTATSGDTSKASTEINNLFPVNNYFMKSIDVFTIDTKSVPNCKQTFTQLCGTAKFPLPASFTSCLQTKYSQYKENASCENLGSALVVNNYFLWLVLTTKPCDRYFDKCFTSLNPRTKRSYDSCLANDSSVPPLCIKIIQDYVLNTYVLSEIYDRLKTSW